MHDLFLILDQFSDKSQSELEIVMPKLLSLEIDATRFSSCIRNQRHFPQIKQDYEDGSFLDIEGTPTWFINNNRLIGSITKILNL